MRDPFPDFAPDAGHHFRLFLLAAAARIFDRAAADLGSDEGLYERFPFAGVYREELLRRGVEGGEDAGPWPGIVESFERRVPGHLPMRALRAAAGADLDAMTLLVAVGLVEEDARFGALFEGMHGIAGVRRPTLGLLDGWWPSAAGGARSRLRWFRELGLVDVLNPDAPRSEWALHVPALLWDALRGDSPERPGPGFRHLALAGEGGEPLGFPDALAAMVRRLPALVGDGDVRAIVVRGPRHNGRRSLLREVARSLGRGVLEVDRVDPRDARWRAVGPLSTLLHALPVAVFEPAPGEKVELPALAATDAPLTVILPRHGGVAGPGAERALTLEVTMPGPEERRALWARALGEAAPEDLGAVARRHRLPAGAIDRAARLARAHAALAGRSGVAAEDVRAATRDLGREALETLAVRLGASAGWGDLALSAETTEELRHLEQRCRHRERLASGVGDGLARQLNAGVRALFKGPSGTGKTLAARALASALDMDVYRVDLSAVVDKYIGETEKNLSRVFSLAEDLDVILLFDEGDALLARRTSVQTSNDRYANLETNYLLQRIESYEGILVVTTNAGDLIDSAFERRMDVVVPFRAPEPAERWAIWNLHLPGAHAVEGGWLREIAVRCALTGGQIRNAVLHASLLAVKEGGAMATAHVESGVLREYRKAGAVYPVRRL